MGQRTLLIAAIVGSANQLHVLAAVGLGYMLYIETSRDLTLKHTTATGGTHAFELHSISDNEEEDSIIKKTN